MAEKEEGKGGKTAVVFVLAVLLFIAGYMLNKPKDETIKPGDYPIQKILYGVKVYSKIPVEDVSSWNDISLFQSNLPGALSCNLEFSVLKPKPEARFYSIEMEKGESSVFIDERRILVRGMDEAELVYNCHAISCLLSNVSCPENIDEIKKVMWFTDELNVVLDSNLSVQAMGAYAELMGPLGFYQMMKADLDKNGAVDGREKAANRVFIYPYFKFNGSCVLQPVKNLVQELNASEAVTRDCDIKPAVYIEEAPVNEIKVAGEKITLRGDSNALRASAIIVGDVIAPDWMTSFRQAG